MTTKFDIERNQAGYYTNGLGGDWVRVPVSPAEFNTRVWDQDAMLSDYGRKLDAHKDESEFRNLHRAFRAFMQGSWSKFMAQWTERFNSPTITQMWGMLYDTYATQLKAEQAAAIALGLSEKHTVQIGAVMDPELESQSLQAMHDACKLTLDVGDDNCTLVASCDTADGQHLERSIDLVPLLMRATAIAQKHRESCSVSAGYEGETTNDLLLRSQAAVESSRRDRPKKADGDDSWLHSIANFVRSSATKAVIKDIALAALGPGVVLTDATTKAAVKTVSDAKAGDLTAQEKLVIIRKLSDAGDPEAKATLKTMVVASKVIDAKNANPPGSSFYGKGVKVGHDPITFGTSVGASSAQVRIMNQAAWDKLPEDFRKRHSFIFRRDLGLGFVNWDGTMSAAALMVFANAYQATPAGPRGRGSNYDPAAPYVPPVPQYPPGYPGGYPGGYGQYPQYPQYPPYQGYGGYSGYPGAWGMPGGVPQDFGMGQYLNPYDPYGLGVGPGMSLNPYDPYGFGQGYNPYSQYGNVGVGAVTSSRDHRGGQVATSQPSGRPAQSPYSAPGIPSTQGGPPRPGMVWNVDHWEAPRANGMPPIPPGMPDPGPYGMPPPGYPPMPDPYGQYGGSPYPMPPGVPYGYGSPGADPYGMQPPPGYAPDPYGSNPWELDPVNQGNYQVYDPATDSFFSNQVNQDYDPNTNMFYPHMNMNPYQDPYGLNPQIAGWLGDRLRRTSGAVTRLYNRGMGKAA